jgi:alanine or glycine:cation symporter, AGCS family
VVAGLDKEAVTATSEIHHGTVTEWMGDVTEAQIAGGVDKALDTCHSRAFELFAGIMLYSIPINYGTAVPFIVGWLVVGATVRSCGLGLAQPHDFDRAISLVDGDDADPADTSEVAHLQSRPCPNGRWQARVDAAGVAISVSIDRAGATFGSIVAGLRCLAAQPTLGELGVN